MSPVLIVIAGVVVWLAIATAKEMHVDAKHRWEDRVMKAHLKAESAYYHRCRLEAIDRTTQAKLDELDRIVADENVIKGTCREVSREAR
jgi:hypothetical protein